ncbi:MAG TPA: hypothetical protein VNS29_15370 [Burkholderiaceae bacterium]|nr:hypothetical protein [Burkholderiaceae bacterium]
MFELKDHQVKLASVNPRAEIHGEDRVPACDLKIEAACSSEVLIYLHSQLRQLLFKKNDSPDLVDQVQDSEALTELRFPKMGPIKWTWEGTGYTLTVDYGLGDASNIVLGDCEVDNFKIDPMEGGTVNISFRVICHPETADVGRLCEMIQREIQITLAPPEPVSVQELFGE